MGNGLTFFLVLVASVFFAAPVWVLFNPLRHWFLETYANVFPPNLLYWMDMLSPILVYLLVVVLLSALVQGLIVTFFRQKHEEWIFKRWQRTVNGRNRKDR